jgi:hypothetical protein
MSLKQQEDLGVPDETRRVAMAAFPKSCACLRIGDVWGSHDPHGTTPGNQFSITSLCTLSTADFAPILDHGAGADVRYQYLPNFLASHLRLLREVWHPFHKYTDGTQRSVHDLD